MGINKGGRAMSVMKPCPRCKRMMPYGPAYCKDCAPIAKAELEAIKERNADKAEECAHNHVMSTIKNNQEHGL